MNYIICCFFSVSKVSAQGCEALLQEKGQVSGVTEGRSLRPLARLSSSRSLAGKGRWGSHSEVMVTGVFTEAGDFWRNEHSGGGSRPELQDVGNERRKGNGQAKGKHHPLNNLVSIVI